MVERKPSSVDVGTLSPAKRTLRACLTKIRTRAGCLLGALFFQKLVSPVQVSSERILRLFVCNQSL